MSGAGDTPLDDLVEQTRRRVAAIEQLLEDVRSQAGDDDEAVETEAFARRARTGELGRDWMVLQGRIDLQLTSMEAIMDGSDDSSEAETVRGTSRSRLDNLVEFVRDQAKSEGKPDPFAELERDREHLIARGAAVRQRLNDLSNDSATNRES